MPLPGAAPPLPGNETHAGTRITSLERPTTAAAAAGFPERAPGRERACLTSSSSAPPPARCARAAAPRPSRSPRGEGAEARVGR